MSLTDHMQKNLSLLVKDPDLERLELNLKSPNFFSILNIEKREIRHSNFLSWLLDPSESHNLSGLFLTWFLKDIFSNEKIKWTNEFLVDTIDMRNIRLYREWRHIDILIESDNFVIVIENKIDSKERSNQLSAYRKIINENFPKKYKVFVYLSPTNLMPQKEIDRDIYIIYSYNEIKKNIETVLDVYKQSISDRVKLYLEDYLIILRRDIMKEHESIDLARLLYNNHKAAFDFIIENKPDRLYDVSPIIEKVVEKKGFILGSINKGYIRFLTPKLYSVIPRTGQGWSMKESFVFEIDIWPKNLALRTAIAPGNEHNRKILHNALMNTKGSKKPTGKQWLCHFSKSKKVDISSENYEDDSKVEQVISTFLDECKDMITDVEEAILKVTNDFDESI